MSYRLVINPAIELGDNTISMTFSSLEELKAAERCSSLLLLFLEDDLNLLNDYSNYFVTEEWVDGKWEYLDD